MVAVVPRPGRRAGPAAAATTPAVGAGSASTARSMRTLAWGQRRFSALLAIARPSVRTMLARRLIALGAGDVAEAATVADALMLARDSSPRALVVVEPGLPDGSGLALLDELRAAGWAHGIVIADADDLISVRAALSCGVRGLLVGQSASSAPAPMALLHARPAGGVASLSAREVEVLRLVADGQSNRDVGASLGLSALTVKSHLARVARKLGTGDRAEMVATAMRGGLFR